MRKPLMDIQFFKKRQERLSELMGENEALILFSGSAPVRSNDTNYKFRPPSNFFYLTGFEEEEAVFVYRPYAKEKATLFVQKKNPELETWEGFLFGEALAKDAFKMDQTFAIDQLSEELPELLQEAQDIYYRVGLNDKNDNEVISSLKTILRKKGRKGNPLQNIKDPDIYLAKMRVVKTEEEIGLMKETCKISAKAHVEVMKHTKPGVNERYLEGVFLSSIIKEGANGVAYNSIVAGGDNATTLHYVFNDEVCKDKDLLLIDAGSEYKYYAGDITRTYPVGDSFSEIQEKLYTRILEVQKKLVSMVKPGCHFKLLNETCAKELIKIMIDFKLLSGSVDENYENSNYKKYYPHGVGHFIGIDVHDIGYYEENGKPVEFVPGMALTIEPGLYIPKKDESAPKELLGIGIRIEDDILVTNQGNEVLTKDVPKEISEILAIKNSKL